VAEGRLITTRDQDYTRLAEFLERARLMDKFRRPIKIPPNSIMWNAGVIGLDPSDCHLLQNALHLADEIWAQFRFHTVDQFALGHVLERHTSLQPADDIVFHYWAPHLRSPFRQRLRALLSSTEHLPVVERASLSYEHRPRPTWSRRSKIAVKRRLQD